MNPGARRLRAVAPSFLAALGLALTYGCAGTLSAATDDDALAIAGAPVEAAAAVDWSAPVDARILMAEFVFAPRELAFEAGRPVRLEIRNAG